MSVWARIAASRPLPPDFDRDEARRALERTRPIVRCAAMPAGRSLSQLIVGAVFPPDEDPKAVYQRFGAIRWAIEEAGPRWALQEFEVHPCGSLIWEVFDAIPGPLVFRVKSHREAPEPLIAITHSGEFELTQLSLEVVDDDGGRHH